MRIVHSNISEEEKVIKAFAERWMEKQRRKQKEQIKKEIANQFKNKKSDVGNTL